MALIDFVFFRTLLRVVILIFFAKFPHFSASFVPFFVAQNSFVILYVQLFDLASCPFRLSEKLQTGFDARIVRKAANRYFFMKFLPTVSGKKIVQYGF